MRRSKKTSKLRFTGLCVENSLGTGEFPVQMASNAENASIWWRHRVILNHWRQHWSCWWWLSLSGTGRPAPGVGRLLRMIRLVHCTYIFEGCFYPPPYLRILHWTRCYGAPLHHVSHPTSVPFGGVSGLMTGCPCGILSNTIQNSWVAKTGNCLTNRHNCLIIRLMINCSRPKKKFEMIYRNIIFSCLQYLHSGTLTTTKSHTYQTCFSNDHFFNNINSLVTKT